MKKTIIDIAPAKQDSLKRKRVAAYCRVSCGKDTMLHSLHAQIDYYHKLITMNPEKVLPHIKGYPGRYPQDGSFRNPRLDGI